MELHEALEVIEATKGMFHDLYPSGRWDAEFLRTPVECSFENYYDENFILCTEMKKFFYHKRTGEKVYIVDIRPVCIFLVNEWPSANARKVRKWLLDAYDYCFEAGKKSLSLLAPILYAMRWWEKEHYYFSKRGRKIHDLNFALTDTLHEMYHALRATEEDYERTDTVLNSPKDIAIIDEIEASLHPEAQKRIYESYKKSHQNKSDKTKPTVLCTDEAETYWKLLKKAGFVGDDCRLLPNTSRKQAMLIAELFAEKLNVKSKWKTFQEFWGINNLAQEKWDYQQTGISPARQQEIMDIFEK